MTCETILGYDMGVRAAALAMTPGTGDSFTLRAQDANAGMYLISMHASMSVASGVYIRSPRMHDNVTDLQFLIPAYTGFQPCFMGLRQPLVPQDNLSVVRLAGGAAAVPDLLAFTIYYENLVGAAGNLFTWDSIKDSIKNLTTVTVTAGAPATGQWTSSGAINVTQDLLKANTNYAILAAHSIPGACIVAVSGPCTGNVRLGIPTRNLGYDLGSRYLVDLSRISGLATIPVMKSADKGATLVYLADPTLSVTSATLLLAELTG